MDASIILLGLIVLGHPVADNSTVLNVSLLAENNTSLNDTPDDVAYLNLSGIDPAIFQSEMFSSTPWYDPIANDCLTDSMRAFLEA